MVFKTHYQKLRRLYTEMQQMITKYSNDAVRIVDAFTGGDVRVLDGMIFSSTDYTINCTINPGTEQTKFLEFYYNGELLKRFRINAPTFSIGDDDLKELIGDFGTVESLVEDACTKAASIQTMGEAARLVLLGQYSPEALMTSMRAKTSDNLMLSYAAMDDIIGALPDSDRLGSATAMIAFIEKNMSYLNKTTASESSNSIEWTTVDYSYKHIAGFGWLDILSSAVTAVSTLLAFVSPVLALAISAVVSIASSISNLVTQNVSTTTTVNYGTGMPSWNLRIGRLRYIPSFLESAVQDSGCATFVGQYVCMYAWVDDNGGKYTEIYPSAYGQVGSHPGFTNDNRFKVIKNYVGETDPVFEMTISRSPNSDTVYDDYAPFFNGPLVNDFESSTEEQKQWTITNCLVRWALTYASKANRVLQASAAEMNVLETNLSSLSVDGVAMAIINYSADISSTIADVTYQNKASKPLSWQYIKKVCQFLDGQGSDPWLNHLWSSGSPEIESIDPFIIDRGNFMLMAPEYASNTMVNTILAYSACILGAMAMAYGAYKAYKVVKVRSVQKRLVADQARMRATASGSIDDTKAYMKADRQAKRYENLVRSVGAQSAGSNNRTVDLSELDAKLNKIIALIGGN